MRTLRQELMRPLLGGADSNYLREIRTKTLLFGKLYSALALVVVSAFGIFALCGPLGVQYLPWCLAGAIPAFLFLTLGAELFARRPSLIVPFHAFSLLGLQVMTMGTASNVLLIPNRVVGVWIVVLGLVAFGIVLAWLLAAGVRPFLWAVLILPLLALSLFLLRHQILTYRALLMLSSIWVIAGICSVMALVHERSLRRAYAAKSAALSRSADLERDLESLKCRNIELEREVTKMQKEIEERKAMEAVLEQRASIDDLTGVYNRRAGMEILKQSIYLTDRYSQPLSLCFIDIDDLKAVNDNWGHPAGDELIRRVIAVLKKHFRKSDYICRLGGDEFLAVLTNCAVEAATVILDRIMADLESQSVEEVRFPLAISYGLAERTSADAFTAEEMLRLADNNMYLNKQKKKLNAKNGTPSGGMDNDPITESGDGPA